MKLLSFGHAVEDAADKRSYAQADAAAQAIKRRFAKEPWVDGMTIGADKGGFLVLIKADPSATLPKLPATLTGVPVVVVRTPMPSAATSLMGTETLDSDLMNFARSPATRTQIAGAVSGGEATEEKLQGV